MKTLLALILLATSLPAKEIAKRITNRQFEDGTWSSKETDPEKRRAIERFYVLGSKTPYQTILYQLDEDMNPMSGIYYNARNQVFQKCTYKLDGGNPPRVIQEVVYNAQGVLTGTNNNIYGTRDGRSTLLSVDRYDASGNLIPRAKVTGRKR